MKKFDLYLKKKNSYQKNNIWSQTFFQLRK